MAKWFNKCKQGMGALFQISKRPHVYEAIYRIMSIEQDEHGDYVVIVQLINKSYTFAMKPEEILADDQMTNLFSPVDVRTMTYLGYLDINAPKYKILANRQAEDGGLIFALKEKGQHKPVIKTAEEITADDNMLNQLSQEDAHTVGFTTGTQNDLREQQIRQRLLAEHQQKIQQEKN